MARPSNRQRGRSARPHFVRPRLEVLEDRVVLDVNPIVLENQLVGNPKSEWGITGAGDPGLQGFATQISVDQGETVRFRIDSAASSYRLDIYRMGHYGGLGARKVATVLPTSVGLQPPPIEDPTTGLVDAGNWSESASWNVPTTATSGIYFAKLVRTDGGIGSSHIVFVVRDDDGRSDLLFQTSDTTWQAYNQWGGNSLYRTDDPITYPAGRAAKVSYNRPFGNADPQSYYGVENWVFHSEYPMVQWLEANGYNVSYFTGVDTARRGDEIRDHRAFLSVGHDEYWSNEQRAAMEAARDSGINLAFFSGNEGFWKTRWENSIDGAGSPFKTLVCYKETQPNTLNIDPHPTHWTGTWADARFSPPADGGRPQNALTGQQFAINGTFDARVWVPEEEGKLRFWRNTDLANQQPGQTTGLTFGSLGFEADIDADNGFRPAGSFRVSSATYDVPQLLQEPITYLPGKATHSMTLYKAGSGALVFGAGTIQWSWGLHGDHDRMTTIPDVRMQQATVNLFADMRVQPGSLRPGLVAATTSTDTTTPTAVITSVPGLENAQVGGAITLHGTAADVGGRVAGVEVSTDGGATWRRANGRANWTHVFTPTGAGSYFIRARAIDDSTNTGAVVGLEVGVGSDQGTGPGFVTVAATDATRDSVTVSWTTNEAATSRIDYGLSAGTLTQTLSTSALATQHSFTLTDLLPNTTYVFRLSGTDEHGVTANSFGPPTAPYHFVTPAFQTSTAAEFQNVLPGPGLYVTSEGDGELGLAPAAVTEFSTHVLDFGWQGNILGPFGSIIINGGALSLRQAQVGSDGLYGPGSSMEFIGTFNEALQFGGFIQGANTVPWAVFITLPGGELYARTNNGAGTIVETVLPAAYLNGSHKFRVDWHASSVEYWVDGVRVATHNVSFSTLTRALVAQQNGLFQGLPFVVDSLRVANYPASASFTSLVYDAGDVRRLGPLTWAADVPAGTGLGMRVRTGNTPLPDASWTAFTTVPASGNDIGRLARYVQFQADFSTTANGRTPTLKDVRIGHGPNVAVDFASTGGIGSEVVASATVPVRLSAASTQVVIVNYAATGGTAVGGGVDYILPAGTLVFLPGETSKSIPLSIINEAVIEDDETILVTLSSPSFAALGANTSFTYTITDDDPNTAGIVIDDAEPGFAATSGWERFVGAGFRNDITYVATGDANQYATWTFPVSPGQYRVSATWFANTNRSTDAPFTIFDGATPVSSVRVNQRLAPADFLDGGSGWKDLDIVSITGNSLVVRLSADASPSFVIADAMRIEWRGELAPGPQARLFDGTNSIVNGGLVDLGTTVVGAPVTKTFTVRNVGTEALVLQEPITAPTGFSVASSFGQTTLAPGATTTFSIRLDASSGGTHTGRVSFASNDADDNPYRFTVSGAVGTVATIDNGDPGFAATSAWLGYVGLGHQNDIHYVDSGDANQFATWTFPVSPGQYRVSATWHANTNRADNAPYALLDGSTQVGLVRVNQRNAPNDFAEGGSNWENLDTVTVAGNSLVVRLSADATPSYVIADAIRIERVGDSTLAPEIRVQDGDADIVDGTGSVGFGTVVEGNPVSKTFTVRNQGTAALTLGPSITAPSGFTVTSGFGATTLAPGESTTFTVRLDAVTAGTYSGEVSFANNDADEAPFNFTVTGTVSPTPVPEIEVKDGDTNIVDGTGSVAFGTVVEGNPVSKTFTVRNTGTATLTVGPSVSVPSGFTLTADLGSTSLAPGASTTFAVRLDAVTAGTYSGEVSFANNDADEAPFNFTITGTVTVPVPEIEVKDGDTNIVDGTGSVAFGTVVEGNPVSKTFTVRNQGTAALTLGPSVSVPSGFTLTTDLGSTSLAPGASTTFSVRLDAATAGTYSGEVSFANNDADEAPFNFTVSGTVTVPVPEIQVQDGTTNIADGGSVAFGSAVVGNPVSKTFTVRNQGTAALTLGPSVSVPTGFTLTTDLGATTLAPGENTTFTVRLDAATAGTYSGEVSFANNDADEAPFNFTVTGTVTAAGPPVQIIDDGATGFSTTGTWDSYTGEGQGNDFSYSLTGTGADTASWTFPVGPGLYRVSATWVARPNRATDAPYTLLDGATVLGTVRMNQRLTPNDFTDAGSGWKDLDVVSVSGTSLTVRLSDSANSGYVIADAVRIERVGDQLVGPHVQVRDGGDLANNGATIDLGAVIRGVSVTRTFTVRNIGTEDLVLQEPISVPAGFTLESTFAQTTLAPNASTTFTVRLDTAAVGTYSGEVSFASNDPDTSPFRLTLRGQVTNVATIDNGEAGFAATGGWETYGGLGYGSDIHYILSGTGSQSATWTFNVAAGTYRVSATWWQNTNRVSNAPFTILDGATTVGSSQVDQRNAPNDFTEGGSGWENLAEVTITGTTLVVRLSDDADAGRYLIADAIRIERI